MINLIFQKSKANGKMVVQDNRAFFRKYYDPKWFDDYVVQNIIYYVDRAEVIMDDILRGFNGKTIIPEQLSTGAKTAILVWKFPDVIFNMSQCGDNAFKCVMDICSDGDDRTEMTYRYLPEKQLRRTKVLKDGKDFDMDDYDDLVDEWLLESLND